MSATYTQCRYLRRNDEQCTGEALDDAPDAEILLCLKHSARVMRMVAEHQKTSRLARRTA